MQRALYNFNLIKSNYLDVFLETVFLAAVFEDAAFEDAVFEQEHLEEDLQGALVEESCSIAIAQNCSSLPDGQPAFCQM